MHRCRHLLVGLARNGADEGLIRYSAMLGRLGIAVEIRFVHVMPAHSDETHRSQILAAMEAEVQAVFSGESEGNSEYVKTYCNVLKGPLVDRLLEYSIEQEVELILVGQKTERPSRRALARRLAMKAPCSVWMMPQGSPANILRILVPVDFSERAADALAAAASLCRLCGLSECIALHVYFDTSVTSFEEYDRVLRGKERDAFDNFLEPIDLQGVEVESILEESANVSHAINRVVEEREIDLVVMATRGRSRSAAILLGSDAEQAIIECRVPLLAIKQFGASLNVVRALLNPEFIGKKGPRFG